MTISSEESSTSSMVFTRPMRGVTAMFLDAFAAAGLQAIHLHIGALAESVFRDRQNPEVARLMLLGRNRHANHVSFLARSMPRTP